MSLDRNKKELDAIVSGDYSTCSDEELIAIFQEADRLNGEMKRLQDEAVKALDNWRNADSNLPPEEVDNLYRTYHNTRKAAEAAELAFRYYRNTHNVQLQEYVRRGLHNK